MIRNLFEESAISFTAKVVRGKKRFLQKVPSKKVKFTFAQEGGATQLAEAEVETKSDQVTHEVTLPRVADDEDSFSLTCRIDAGGDIYDYPSEFKVWPASVVLTAETSDGAPAKGFLFTYKQQGGGISGDGRTGDDGKATVRPVHAGPITFEAKVPWTIMSWRTAAGSRARVAVVKRQPYPAELRAPVKDTDDERAIRAAVAPAGADAGVDVWQYVNETTASSGHDRLGQKVKVVVGAVGDLTRAPNARLALPGDPIHVKLTFTREQRVLDKITKMPKGLDPAETDGEITKTDSDKVQEAKVLVGPDGTASFTVDLGHTGGDRCEVAVGSTPQCGDAKLVLLNFRRLYYQVTSPASIAVPSLADCKAKFGKVYVALQSAELDGADDKVVEVPSDFAVAGRGSWISDIGYTNDPAFIVGDHNSAEVHQGFLNPPASKKRLCLHFLFVDAQVDKGGNESKLLTVAHDGTNKIPWPPPAAADGPTQYADPSVNATGGSAVFGVCFRFTDGPVYPIAIKTGAHAVYKREWKKAAGSTWHTIPEADVVVRYSRTLKTNANEQHGRLYAKLPDAAKAELEAGRSVKVRFSWYKGDGPYCGESHGDHGHWLLLSTEYDLAENVDTIIHETGHAMRMALDDQIDVPDFPYTQDAPTQDEKLVALRTWHDKWYSKQGDHCGATGAGADLAKRANPAQEGPSVPAANRCVMHGNGGKQAGSEYCDKCAVLVMAQTIVAVET